MDIQTWVLGRRFLEMDKMSHITPTEKGLEVAQRVYHRHKVLTRFLQQLGVDEETAREDACKIEHHLSPQTFNAILNQVEK